MAGQKQLELPEDKQKQPAQELSQFYVQDRKALLGMMKEMRANWLDRADTYRVAAEDVPMAGKPVQMEHGMKYGSLALQYYRAAEAMDKLIKAVPSENTSSVQQDYDKLLVAAAGTMMLRSDVYAATWQDANPQMNTLSGKSMNKTDLREYIRGGMNFTDHYLDVLGEQQALLGDRKTGALFEKFNGVREELKEALAAFDRGDFFKANFLYGAAATKYEDFQAEFSKHLASAENHQALLDKYSPTRAWFIEHGFNATAATDMIMLGAGIAGAAYKPAAFLSLASSSYFMGRGVQGIMETTAMEGTFRLDQNYGNLAMIAAPASHFFASAKSLPAWAKNAATIAGQGSGAYLMFSGGAGVYHTLADSKGLGLTPEDWGVLWQNGVFLGVGAISLAGKGRVSEAVEKTSEKAKSSTPATEFMPRPLVEKEAAPKAPSAAERSSAWRTAQAEGGAVVDSHGRLTDHGLNEFNRLVDEGNFRGIADIMDARRLETDADIVRDFSTALSRPESLFLQRADFLSYIDAAKGSRKPEIQRLGKLMDSKLDAVLPDSLIGEAQNFAQDFGRDYFRGMQNQQGLYDQLAAGYIRAGPKRAGQFSELMALRILNGEEPGSAHQFQKYADNGKGFTPQDFADAYRSKKSPEYLQQMSGPRLTRVADVLAFMGDGYMAENLRQLTRNAPQNAPTQAPPASTTASGAGQAQQLVQKQVEAAQQAPKPEAALQAPQAQKPAPGPIMFDPEIKEFGPAGIFQLAATKPEPATQQLLVDSLQRNGMSETDAIFVGELARLSSEGKTYEIYASRWAFEGVADRLSNSGSKQLAEVGKQMTVQTEHARMAIAGEVSPEFRQLETRRFQFEQDRLPPDMAEMQQLHDLAANSKDAAAIPQFERILEFKMQIHSINALPQLTAAELSSLRTMVTETGRPELAKTYNTMVGSERMAAQVSLDVPAAQEPAELKRINEFYNAQMLPVEQKPAPRSKPARQPVAEEYFPHEDNVPVGAAGPDSGSTKQSQ